MVRWSFPPYRLRPCLGMLVLALASPVASAKVAKTSAAFAPANAPSRFAEIVRQIGESNAPELVGRRRWSALVAQHREAVEACRTHEAFASAVNGLIEDSGVSHFHYYTDDQWQYWHLQSAFGDEGEGTQIEHIGVIPEEIDGRWFVRGILEGSPADGMDIKVGDELVAVDGLPFAPVASFRGLAGSLLSLRLARRPGRFHEVEVTPVSESLYLAMQRAILKSIRTIENQGLRFAYLHGWTLLGRGEEYDQLSLMQNEVDALILDYRDGFGGRWHAAERFLVGGGDEASGLSIPPVWVKPVVILTGDGTRSAKEIVIHKVKRSRRAPLIGEPSPGHVVSVGSIVAIGDDGLLMLPGHRFDLEGKPTRPDYPVKRKLPYSAGADPQMDFALKLLTKMAREQQRVLGAAE